MKYILNNKREFQQQKCLSVHCFKYIEECNYFWETLKSSEKKQHPADQT